MTLPNLKFRSNNQIQVRARTLKKKIRPIEQFTQSDIQRFMDEINLHKVIYGIQMLTLLPGVHPVAGSTMLLLCLKHQFDQGESIEEVVSESY
uniref:Uncharacterized protein n=1 Tax=Panagrolaimus davidi TaxID=227884 RepID=A0A914P6K9_9BILA